MPTQDRTGASADDANVSMNRAERRALSKQQRRGKKRSRHTRTASRATQVEHGNVASAQTKPRASARTGRRGNR